MLQIFLKFYYEIRIENFIQIISNVSIIVTLFTGIFFNVRSNFKLRKQNSISNIIELEKDLLDCKRMLDKHTFEINKTNDTNEAQDSAYLILLKSEYENYFNILDRICFCFLHKYIPEKEINKEYHNLINKIYESEDYKIKPDENYNLKKYYEKKVIGKNYLI